MSDLDLTGALAVRVIKDDHSFDSVCRVVNNTKCYLDLEISPSRYRKFSKETNMEVGATKLIRKGTAPFKIIQVVETETVLTYEVQYSQSRDVVWVHCSDGSTVGRFGKMGIDIHHSVTDQMKGQPECKLCTHGRVTQEAWDLFRFEAHAQWGVIVDPDAFDPKFFNPE